MTKYVKIYPRFPTREEGKEDQFVISDNEHVVAMTTDERSVLIVVEGYTSRAEAK